MVFVYQSMYQLLFINQQINEYKTNKTKILLLKVIIFSLTLLNRHP
jgi:hypothetical protein